MRIGIGKTPFSSAFFSALILKWLTLDKNCDFPDKPHLFCLDSYLFLLLGDVRLVKREILTSSWKTSDYVSSIQILEEMTTILEDQETWRYRVGQWRIEWFLLVNHGFYTAWDWCSKWAGAFPSCPEWPTEALWPFGIFMWAKL